MPARGALATALADALARLGRSALVHTNIVCADAAKLPEKFVARLGDLGVRTDTIDPRTVRVMTHKDVDDDGITRTIAALDELNEG